VNHLGSLGLAGAKAAGAQLIRQESTEAQERQAHCLHIELWIEKKEELPLMIA
jgi:hypothetical protein